MYIRYFTAELKIQNIDLHKIVFIGNFCDFSLIATLVLASLGLSPCATMITFSTVGAFVDSTYHICDEPDPDEEWRNWNNIHGSLYCK